MIAAFTNWTIDVVHLCEFNIWCRPVKFMMIFLKCLCWLIVNEPQPNLYSGHTCLDPVGKMRVLTRGLNVIDGYRYICADCRILSVGSNNKCLTEVLWSRSEWWTTRYLNTFRLVIVHVFPTILSLVTKQINFVTAHAFYHAGVLKHPGGIYQKKGAKKVLSSTPLTGPVGKGPGKSTSNKIVREFTQWRFERRPTTGSEQFCLLICLGATKFVF